MTIQRDKHSLKQFSSKAFQLGIIAVSILLISCAKNGTFQTIEVSQTNQTTADNTQAAIPSISDSQSETSSPAFKPEPLAWEGSNNPETKNWSGALFKIVGDYFTTLDQAKDVSIFCPKYSSLNKNQRINLWSDIFAATAYYESSWDPQSSSVDVGTANNKDTWSVGLMQMSVVDQANYGLAFGFNFDDLKTPEKNLKLAVAIMSAQVKRTGLVLIPKGKSGVYWATLHPGGRYDRTSNIAKMTKALSFCE